MMIGLMLLLVTITTTINELVIRTLRASHRIEAADRAYFAAEAGIEDALYELSVYTAGYETAPLGSSDVRSDDFTESAPWHNEWEISSKGLNDCSDMDDWALDMNVLDFTPYYCGRIYEGEKLVINLSSDNALTDGVALNAINDADTDVHTLDVTEIMLKFRLPLKLVNSNAETFLILNPLQIDNDGDYNTETGLGLNEDGQEYFNPIDFAPAPCAYSGNVDTDDNDCDGLEDEDSQQDPVLIWKLIDNAGHFFNPLKGCIGQNPLPSHPSEENANVCEISFAKSNDELWASFNQSDMGTDQDGNTTSLQDFIHDVLLTGGTSALRMEIIVVAPFEFINEHNSTKVNIPYFEYGMDYAAFDASAIEVEIPSTYFSIKSDGYYQDFKQSITTNIVPRATTRLLDLTIIQQ